MSKSYIHRPTFGPFRGIDLSVDKLNLPSGHNSEALNVLIPRGSTAAQTRPGYSIIGRTATGAGAGWGLFEYIDTNVTTGAQTKRLISLDVKVGAFFELVERTITISPSTSTFSSKFYVSSTGLRTFAIVDSTTDVAIASFVCDSSVTIPSLTVSQLITAINASPALAVYGISAALGTALGTEVASNFFLIHDSTPFSSTAAAAVITGQVWQSIKAAPGVSTHIATYLATLGATDAEMPTSTNLQGCLYMAFGANVPVLKFDGHRVYVAGMPPAGGTTGTIIQQFVSGGIAAGTYTYLMTYEQLDKKGNIIEGLAYSIPSIEAVTNGYASKPSRVTTTGATTTIEVQVDPLTTTGYSLNKAQVNLNQIFSGATPVITVDSGHTMEVGDIACFTARRSVQIGAIPYISDLLCSVEVTAVTATTITLATVWDVVYQSVSVSALNNATPVQLGEELLAVPFSTLITFAPNVGEFKVLDNQQISNNLRVNIYRNKGAGLANSAVSDWTSTYYLVRTIANPSSVDNDSLTESIPDASLGPALIQKIDFDGTRWPATHATSLPSAKYITAVKDRLYLAGLYTAVNDVDRSDILYGAEWVDPRGLSRLSMDFGQGDLISGIGGTDDYVIVGKTGSTCLIDGDLASESNVRVRVLSNEVNCLSHASMKSITGSIVWASQLGPMIYNAGGGGIDFFGKSEATGKSRLDGAFTASAGVDTRRICAAVDPTRGLYILYVPSLDSDSAVDGFTQFLAPNNSPSYGAAYVYDVLNRAWFKWTGIDATGGIIAFDGDMYFSRAGRATISGDFFAVPCVLNVSNSRFSHVDGAVAIAVAVGTPWDTLSDPFHAKQYVRAGVLCAEVSVPAQALSITTYKNYGDADTSSIATTTLSSTKRRGVVKLKTAKVTSLKTVVSASVLNQRTLLTGIELEAAASFRPKLGVPTS